MSSMDTNFVYLLQHRPAFDIDVPFDYPRHHELRTAQEFSLIAAEISASLR